MIINHEKRFVFIHNPKVGGTSIRKMFLEQLPVNDRYHARGTVDGVVFDTSHLPVTHWTEEIVNAYLEGYYFFGIVKDPVDRFMSALSELMFQTPDFVMRFGYRSVEDFVVDILTRDLSRYDSRFVHFSPQWSYFGLTDPQDSCIKLLPGIKVWNLDDLSFSRKKWEELWSYTIGTERVPEFANFRPSFYKPATLKPTTLQFIRTLYEADYNLFHKTAFERYLEEPNNTIQPKAPTADSVSTERLDWIARYGLTETVALNLRERNAAERNALYGDEFSWAYCQLFSKLRARKA